MLLDVLLVAHIVGLGYWLGSELVINSTYRYVCYTPSLPFEERNKLMDHTLHVDQHVRYALIFQLGTGTALAALYGYIPGGGTAAAIAGAAAVTWLALVEITHRLRVAPLGKSLAAFDRGLRYVVMVTVAGAGINALATTQTLPPWLGWKLICFAGVILCGVGIRYSIIDFYRTWAKIRATGSSDELEAEIRHIYFYGTAILVGLWVFIFVIAALSVWKP